ncbi:MAG: hypothetical protein KA715_13570 [Xanthomonadaceae bacterium]|nr:hypothetical protein [Xanthomonadaceae bacterium]
MAKINFLLLIISLSSCSSIPKKASSLADAPSQTHVIFGGSFDPPTKSHLRLITRLMHREDFFESTLMVAMPYKKESENNGVNLELTKLAMEDMPQILKLEEIPYSEFNITTDGCAEWVELSAKVFHLCPSDLEYKEKIFEDTSKTLKRLNEIYPNGARNLFWVAGTDVLNSITTWPNWKELFALTHWVLIPRGDVTAMTLDVSTKLPADFLAGYTRSTDGKSVQYKNNDSTKPDIFIQDESVLPGSSSEARKMIREQGGKGLDTLLTERVIMKIYEKGYYKEIRKK